jgi:hypothetical protein
VPRPTWYLPITYYRDEAAAILHQEPRLIDWEYEVAAEKLDSEDAIMDSCPDGRASRFGQGRPTGSPNTRPGQACSVSPDCEIWS